MKRILENCFFCFLVSLFSFWFFGFSFNFPGRVAGFPRAASCAQGVCVRSSLCANQEDSQLHVSVLLAALLRVAMSAVPFHVYKSLALAVPSIQIYGNTQVCQCAYMFVYTHIYTYNTYTHPFFHYTGIYTHGICSPMWKITDYYSIST